MYDLRAFSFSRFPRLDSLLWTCLTSLHYCYYCVGGGDNSNVLVLRVILSLLLLLGQKIVVTLVAIHLCLLLS